MLSLELLCYYIGIFIVFASHIFMLYDITFFMSAEKMKMHAYANIVAAVLIAFYFLKINKMV